MKSLFAVVLFVASFAYATPVLDLTANNFQDVMEKLDVPVMVKFYAPWCGHCKRLAPEFEDAGTQLAESGKAKLAKMDCTIEESKEICTKFKVTGYPTLKIFTKEDPENPKLYEGGRKANIIVEYMTTFSLPALIELKTKEEIEDQKNFMGIIAYLKEGEAAVAEFDLLKSAANALRPEFQFAWTTVESGKPANSFYFYKDFDTKETKYDGPLDSDSLQSFCNDESFALLGAIGPENFSKYTDRGLPLGWTFVDYKDPAHENVLKLVEAVAKDYKTKISMVHLDGVEWSAHARTFGISKSTGFVIQEKRKNFVLKEDITVDTLRQHVQGYVDGTVKPNLKSQEIPMEQTKPLYQLVGQSFESVVYDENKDVFVEFYAPWCGHCMNLEPKLEELAKNFGHVKDLIIAQLDSTENDAPVDIAGFPTLIFYPRDNKEGIKYTDDRTVVALTEFIKANAKVDLAAADAEQKETDTVVHQHSEL